MFKRLKTIEEKMCEVMQTSCLHHLTKKELRALANPPGRAGDHAQLVGVAFVVRVHLDRESDVVDVESVRSEMYRDLLTGQDELLISPSPDDLARCTIRDHHVDRHDT